MFCNSVHARRENKQASCTLRLLLVSSKLLSHTVLYKEYVIGLKDITENYGDYICLSRTTHIRESDF